MLFNLLFSNVFFCSFSRQLSNCVHAAYAYEAMAHHFDEFKDARLLDYDKDENGRVLPGELELDFFLYGIDQYHQETVHGEISQNLHSV